MKRLYFILLLSATAFTAQSFKLKPHAHEDFKNDGTITAFVDGKAFELREANKYTAELKNIALDNAIFSSQKSDKLAQVKAAFKFYGLDLSDAQGNLYSESIELHYNFEEGALDEPIGETVVLNYEDQQYFNIPAETKIKITKFEWSPDRTYFIISANFDCLMHRWGMPTNPKQALHLTGKVENINVTVPSNITINPVQVAQK